MLKTSIIDIEHLILLNHFVKLQLNVSVEWIDIICKKQRNRQKKQKHKRAEHRAKNFLRMFLIAYLAAKKHRKPR